MFDMELTDHEEEFLSLSLALVTDSCYEIKTKTKRREETPNQSESSSDQSFEDNKILSLFQTREQMLNPHHRRERSVDTSASDEDAKGLRLIHLLLISATSASQNDTTSALEHLSELYQIVSPTGDSSVQRVAAYFADGLTARILTQKSPFYDAIMKPPTRDEEFLAFAGLYKVSPFYQFAHFTANQAILEAFEKEEEINNRALHVIDFDVSYGFQWPSLMQSLSEKAISSSKRIFFRITGFGRSVEEIQEAESRLVGFSRSFRNIVFEFHGFVRGSKLVKPKMKKNETVVANMVFHLNSLNSYSKISETLNYVYSLSPSIVVLVEQEGSRKTVNFLSRFMESLHYFAAIFDSLDDCLPLDSAERLSIEKNHLGREIKRVMNYDKDGENCLRFEKMETWRGRMEGHGFLGLRQSSNAAMQAKLLLKIRSHCNPVYCDGENNGGGFRVFERDDGKAISLGWQERFLITASSWYCV